MAWPELMPGSAEPKIFTAGSLQTTEQPLDLAINGRGFFQILLPDGTVSYTRDGSFHLNSDGQMVTSNGCATKAALMRTVKSRS